LPFGQEDECVGPFLLPFDGGIHLGRHPAAQLNQLALSLLPLSEPDPGATAVLMDEPISAKVVRKRLEVANAFQSAIRRKRITAPYRDQSLAELTQMPIIIDADTNVYAWTTTLRLAERFALTIYDSSYLELAQRRNLPLAALDTELREAASAVGITLL